MTRVHPPPRRARSPGFTYPEVPGSPPRMQRTEAVDPALGQSWALDRHVLPKIALTFISIAGFAGVYMTTAGHGGSPGMAAVRWLNLMSVGILAGGTMWWGLFLPVPEVPEEREAVGRFLLAQRDRFRWIGLAAVAVALLSSLHLAPMAEWTGGGAAEPLVRGSAAVLLLTLSGCMVLLLWTPEPQEAFAFGGVRALFGGLVAYLVLTAAADARLTFPESASALLLRPIHLVAFALWVGGAVWNIFVSVPAAQRTLSLPVVITGAHALERFRWVVRFILPTLVITGFLQALPYTGLEVAGLTGSLFGRLILFKTALIVGLVVIFLTCPLWRACSPIRGMCDLEDLQRPASPQPAVRIDNRGASCAGFVHVRRALDALQPGAVLEVLSTDPFAWWELPGWVEVNGYRLVQREKERWRLRRSYRFLVRKEGRPSRPGAPAVRSPTTGDSCSGTPQRTASASSGGSSTRADFGSRPPRSV